jgi:hypothetical protein
MRTIATTMWALALPLSMLGGCVPPIAPKCGPDQQEAGPEKGEAGEPDEVRSESPTRAESDKYALIDAYRRCFDSCADAAGDGRSTCLDNCADEVSADSRDPMASACPRSCVDAFGSCLDPCTEPGEGGVEACRRSCQAAAETCLDACN